MISAAGTAPTSKTNNRPIVVKASSAVDAITQTLGSFNRLSSTGKSNVTNQQSGNCTVNIKPDGSATFNAWNNPEVWYSWKPANDGSRPTPEQLAWRLEQELLADEAELERYEATAAKTVEELSHYKPALPTDPTPLKKGIIPYAALRDMRGTTFLPMHYLENGELCNRVEITATKKLFMTGARCTDAWLPLGINATVNPAYCADEKRCITTVPLPPETVLYAVEGWATGCSVHEATGCPTFVSFGANKLLRVAEQLRFMWPNNQIVIAGDAGKVGTKAATQAAESISNCRAIFPEFTVKVDGDDWNDLQQAEGLSVVAAQLSPDRIQQAFTVPMSSAPALPVYADWKAELDAHAASFSQRHVSVMVGGQHRIMRINDDAELEFFNRDAISRLYDNTRIRVGETKWTNHLMAWAKHGDARTCLRGVTFKPGQTLSPDYFNTWRGFAVEPEQRDELLAPIYDHIFSVMCSGNSELNEYFLNWIASGYQYPDRPAGSAVVCRGDKGSGKGLIGGLLLKTWGVHGLHLSNPYHLVGNFNGHLNDKCFIFADESLYCGDPRVDGVLKALVTEPSIIIERKGIDAIAQDNFLKIFMATNSAWCVPASRDERRYCVLDVSNHRVGNRDYFKMLSAAIDDKATQAAFLHAMLNRDVKGWHSGNIPETSGLRDQRYLSFNSLQKWLAEALLNDGFDTQSGYGTWFAEMSTHELYVHYSAYCDRMRLGEYKRLTQCAMGLYLGKLGYQKIRRIDGSGSRGFYFGDLDTAKTRFESYEKVSLEEMS